MNLQTKQLARLFKALSDETRLRILYILTEANEICVCDLETVLRCPQTTVSRHLAILKNAGLVEGRREGLWILYSLTKSRDTVRRSVLKAMKQIAHSTEGFEEDRKKFHHAVEHGRCKTFQVIMPESLPRFLDRRD